MRPPGPLNGSLSPSETLVGSLCREAARLRERWQQLQTQQRHCQEQALRQRLWVEQGRLKQRRLELQRVAGELKRSGLLQDSLAQAFLDELIRRPLPT